MPVLGGQEALFQAPAMTRIWVLALNRFAGNQEDAVMFGVKFKWRPLFSAHFPH
jgi:hypothetical protein